MSTIQSRPKPISVTEGPKGRVGRLTGVGNGLGNPDGTAFDGGVGSSSGQIRLTTDIDSNSVAIEAQRRLAQILRQTPTRVARLTVNRTRIILTLYKH